MANKTYAIKMHLFFKDGDPSGVCEAWMDNWSGHAYKLPRTLLKDPKVIEALDKRPTVYFLFGQTGGDIRAYIGQSDVINTRLDQHDKDPDRGWFSDAVVIIADRNYLNAANIKYLESVFYEDAKKAGRYELDNVVKPSKTNLSESDQATLEEFSDKTKLLISALGYKIFDEIVQPKSTTSSPEQYFFYRKGQPEEAKGYLHPEGFVVCKGSYFKSTEAPKLYSWIKTARLNNSSKITENKTIEDVLLNSPSLAIGFVTGNSGNGNVLWKTEDGKSIGEYNEVKTSNDVK